MGASIVLFFPLKELAIAEVLLNDETVVPKQRKVLLKSGKLSIKELLIGKRNEIYQDHIASVVLHIGRELFSLLPIDRTIINAKSNLLNASTGKLELQTILSVELFRDTMNILNFDKIDPSDCMKNFKCNMNFRKSQGMFPVESLYTINAIKE